MVKMTTNRSTESFKRGMSALFVVIFASMILSLIAVSFTSLMIREQTRSTDDEQSQGAYDAAVAGAEDAKRVILECEAGSGPSQAQACLALEDNPQSCDTVIQAGIAGSSGDDEILISSNASGDGEELNLAYTCVKIQRNTDDYLGSLAQHDDTKMVPLTVAAAASFNEVRISWFSPKDSDTSAPSTAAGYPLEQRTNWPIDRPPILRAQLLQYPRNNLSAAGFFNDSPYAHTVYLYPKTAGTTAADFTLDGRRTSTDPVQQVRCSPSFSVVTGYACQTTLTLPTAGPITSANREGFLRLTSIYGGAHFKVELLNSGNPVDFDNVQPRIDSTGRANDLFRRVESRVEFTSDYDVYPRATVDITNNFCKTFFVAADPGDYADGGCTPAGP